MEDFRVQVGWSTHPKRRLLKRKLGADGVLAVYDLWSFCAQSRPDGDLSGMSDLEIACAADYPGDETEFAATLSELGLLDGEPGQYQIHDWATHNPYVNSAAQRSKSARTAALIRHHKEGRHAHPVDGCPLCEAQQTAVRNKTDTSTTHAESCEAHAESDADLCDPHAAAVRPARIRSAPYPSPSPDPDPSPSPTPSPDRAAPVNTERIWENHDIESVNDLQAAVSSWGWVVQFSDAERRKCRELTDTEPIGVDEWRYAKHEVETRQPARPVSYFLGTVRGQRDEAKKPPRRARDSDAMFRPAKPSAAAGGSDDFW